MRRYHFLTEVRNDCVSERKSAATVRGVSGVWDDATAHSSSGGFLMTNRSPVLYVARVSRMLRRGVAVLMASLLLTALVLPASMTVQTAQSTVNLVGPADGVGDSPVVD
jgi:hypothetical protein